MANQAARLPRSAGAQRTGSTQLRRNYIAIAYIACLPRQQSAVAAGSARSERHVRVGSAISPSSISVKPAGHGAGTAHRTTRPPCAVVPEVADLELAQPLVEDDPGATGNLAPAVEFLGVVQGMLSARGALHLPVHPDEAYAVLTDYEACSDVFRNIAATRIEDAPCGGRRIVQACGWSFLGFSGTFDISLNVTEEPAQRLLVFRLHESSFMADFEGRWQVGVRLRAR